MRWLSRSKRLAGNGTTPEMPTYRAADWHDNEGMRKYSTLWNTYEARLINLREDRTDVIENLSKEKKDTALKRGDNDE